MTYSPDQIAAGHRMNQLLDTLEHDVSELRQMVSIYEDAVTMPGRVPDVDVDGTGRQATHGPSRPTERIALDDQREALQRELNSGATHLPYAAAVVRGVIASMDRALSRWEGEGEVRERIGGVSP